MFLIHTNNMLIQTFLEKGCGKTKTNTLQNSSILQTDIDECEQEGTCKSEHMSCNNIVGSYYCDCADGYERMGGECIETELCEYQLSQNVGVTKYIQLKSSEYPNDHYMK